jgi:hypothetical protein
MTITRRPDELAHMEVAAQTRLGLLNLWLGVQPQRTRRAVKRAALTAVLAFALAGLAVYFVVLPLSPAIGRGLLIAGGLLLVGAGVLLTRPPGIEAPRVLAAVRDHHVARAQGRIFPEEAAERLGIDTGIPLAAYDDRRIGLDAGAQQHVLVCAPTGAGKGLHLTDTLLAWPGSALIVDPKAEQFERTSGFRHAQGQAVYRIPGHAIDLSQFYDLRDFDDAATLHRQLLRPPSAGDNKVFYDKSRVLFQAIGWYAHANGQNPIHALVTAGATPMFPVLQALYDCPASHIALLGFTDGLNPHDVDVLSSYRLVVNAWSNFSTALGPLVKHVDTIAPPPGATHVIPPDWAERGSSLYLTYDFADLDGGLGMLVSAVIAAIMRRQKRRQQPADILLAIDELAAVKLQDLAGALATMRGYGVRLLLYAQDMNQLVTVYHEEAQTILSNCGSQVWYPTGEYNSAQHMSRLLGTRVHTSLSATGMSLDPMRQHSPDLRYVEQFAAAIEPTEASSLPTGSVLVLVQAPDRQYRFLADRCDPRKLLRGLPPPLTQRREEAKAQKAQETRAPAEPEVDESTIHADDAAVAEARQPPLPGTGAPVRVRSGKKKTLKGF